MEINLIGKLLTRATEKLTNFRDKIAALAEARNAKDPAVLQQTNEETLQETEFEEDASEAETLQAAQDNSANSSALKTALQTLVDKLKTMVTGKDVAAPQQKKATMLKKHTTVWLKSCTMQAKAKQEQT